MVEADRQSPRRGYGSCPKDGGCFTFQSFRQFLRRRQVGMDDFVEDCGMLLDFVFRAVGFREHFLGDGVAVSEEIEELEMLAMFYHSPTWCFCGGQERRFGEMRVEK